MSRDEKNCNRVTFRNSLFCVSKSKMESGVGMSYHVPITVFLSPILSEQEGKSKGIGRGSEQTEVFM